MRCEYCGMKHPVIEAHQTTDMAKITSVYLYNIMRCEYCGMKYTVIEAHQTKDMAKITSVYLSNIRML